MSTKKIIIILVSAVVLVGLVLVGLWLFNRMDIQQEQTPLLKSVGSVEGNQMVMADGARSFFLEQGLTLEDEDGNRIAPSLVKSIKVKYPSVPEFMDVNISVDRESGAIFSLAVRPPLEFGDYIFRVEYQNGAVEEKTVLWDQPKEIMAQATGENDVIKGTAYQLGDLDLTSFEQAYHIRPSGSALKIESSGDKCFWLKDSTATSGEHAVLVKQNSIWYMAKINI